MKGKALGILLAILLLAQVALASDISTVIEISRYGTPQITHTIKANYSILSRLITAI
jgi:hypothetical protein